LFFISLGMKIKIPPTSELLSIFLIVLFAILVKFFLITPLVKLSGTSYRNSIVSAINLSQISEFSLVILSIGVSLNHINSRIMLFALYTMAITAILSSYTIRFSQQIYKFFEKTLGLYHTEVKENSTHNNSYEVYILGYHRGAKAFIESIVRSNIELLEKILLIDFNQETLRDLKAMGVACLYGDISNIDVLEHSNISQAKVIVSTIPDLLLRGTDNLHLVKICRELSPNAYIIASADMSHLAEPLSKGGADQVLLPYSMMGDHLLEIVNERLSSPLKIMGE